MRSQGQSKLLSIEASTEVFTSAALKWLVKCLTLQVLKLQKQPMSPLSSTQSVLISALLVSPLRLFRPLLIVTETMRRLMLESQWPHHPEVFHHHYPSAVTSLCLAVISMAIGIPLTPLSTMTIILLLRSTFKPEFHSWWIILRLLPIIDSTTERTEFLSCSTSMVLTMKSLSARLNHAPIVRLHWLVRVICNQISRLSVLLVPVYSSP